MGGRGDTICLQEEILLTLVRKYKSANLQVEVTVNP